MQDRYRNLTWLNSQETLKKGGDGFLLKYENLGVRYWFHPESKKVRYEVRDSKSDWHKASEFTAKASPLVQKKS